MAMVAPVLSGASAGGTWASFDRETSFPFNF
jgi:hypothetical protein